jgi:hypothetical protein
MSARLKFFLLSVIVLITSAAFAQPTIVNFDFGGVPIVCGADYAYEWPGVGCRGFYHIPIQDFNSAPGFGWILNLAYGSWTGGSGLTGPNTAFCPPSFEGMPFKQVVFLQSNNSFVAQAVEGFTAGRYTLSFYLGGRCGGGAQTVEAMIDDHVIGTWNVVNGMPFTLESAAFAVSTGGSHMLMFRGISPGDETAFLSYVTITPAGGR